MGRCRLSPGLCLLLLAVACSLAAASQAPKIDAPSELPSSIDLTGAGTNQEDVSAKLRAALDVEKLGPVVITEDGKLTRINNWAELTPEQQREAKKKVAAKNKERAAKLKQKLGIKQEEEPALSVKQRVAKLSPSDFLLFSLLAIVLLYVVPTKVHRWLNGRQEAQRTKATNATPRNNKKRK